MKRRALLASIGAAGLAGCTADAGEQQAERTRDTPTHTSSPTATSAPSDEPTETRTPADPWNSPGSHTALRGSTEVTFGEVAAKRYLRYYDEENDQLRRYEPNRDLWMQAAITTKNLGGDEITPPPPDAFELDVHGVRIGGRTSYDGLSWEDVRLREHAKAYWIEPGYLGSPEPIDGGESALLYLVFDAPNDERVALCWKTESETYRLSPRFVIPPE